MLIFSPLSAKDPDEWTHIEKVRALEALACYTESTYSGWKINTPQLMQGVCDLSENVIDYQSIIDQRFVNDASLKRYIELVDNTIDFLSSLIPLTFITHLYLDGLELKELPVVLKYLKNVRHISLRHNRLTQIPSHLPPNLKILSLAHNQITAHVSLNDTTCDLLEKIDLSHNAINSLFINSKNLRVVDVSHNALESIGIGPQITRLTWLDLHKNDLKNSEVFDTIEHANISLDYLDLTQNYLLTPSTHSGGETTFLGYDLAYIPLILQIDHWLMTRRRRK